MASEKELQAELDNLRADMAKLREDLSGLVGALKDAGISKASNMREEVGEFVDETEEKARKILSMIKDKSKAGAAYAGEKVGEHPLITVLAAFGAGFLVAKLLDRK